MNRMDNTRILLLDESGNVQYGLNWGIREKRDHNQAYLQLLPEIWKSNFFPTKGIYFLCRTDDGDCFALNRAQKNEYGTAIQTPENNAILGLYIRKRLGLESGVEITKDAIVNYGRCDIEFFKIDNRHYEMSYVQNWKSEDISYLFFNYLLLYKGKSLKEAQSQSGDYAEQEYYSEFLKSDYYKIHYGKDETINKKDTITHPLQQIFYGAPGTGKSHKVKEVTDTLPKSDVFRTTFHPDSDYSTFVGCYKPKMVKAPIRDSSGHEITSACEDEKKRIAYEYEPQAFLKAYVRAYETSEPVFLVIEEINRGNCAQIFGDMFQLLDRNESGESDYAIKPETAIQEFLNEKLKGCDIADETIKSGEEMRLPANLHIWATMNTSDQSLFPIDSAFKRRWDWKYMPINPHKESWSIKVNGTEFSWSDFLEKINGEIDTVTHSEDKKLGFYFCKAENGVISAERFVSKVLFYIWNDVFKDYGFEKDIFNDTEGKLSFGKFYHENGEIREDNVELFLKNLVVDIIKTDDTSINNSHPEANEDGNI